MSRVPPTPVEVLVDGTWHRGTVRRCDISPDGGTCSAIVSWGGPVAAVTARFEPSSMRSLSKSPGCPAPHDDETR